MNDQDIIALEGNIFQKKIKMPSKVKLAKQKGMDLTVIPLHKHPEYMEQCCNLINEEWQRSQTARMRSLQSSRDELPTCLVLVKDNHVIGHSKLSPIFSIPNACFIESVVIKRNLRGKGYGRYLMERTEDYCSKILHLKTIYLSTHDQELFYSKLGYNICQPISIYGSPNGITSITISCDNKTKSKDDDGVPVPPPLPNTNTSLQCKKTYMNKVL